MFRLKSESKTTRHNNRFAQLPGSVSSLSFGFIIYICLGDMLQLVSLAIRQLADLARLPMPATVQTPTLAAMPKAFLISKNDN
jgi:uncharacterized membrane protein